MKEKRFSIVNYLKKHKISVFLHVLTTVIACFCDIAITLLSANAIASLTSGNFELSLKLMLITLIVIVLKRLMWWTTSLLYFILSNQIWGEMSEDLTKRCFTISSSTFSEHNSGSFVQRILDDPRQVLDLLSELIDLIATTISSIVMVVYIICLNWLVGVLYVAILIALFFLERLRQSFRRKNKFKKKKMNENVYSLVNEIVRSEKDIKSLNLEAKLSESMNSRVTDCKKINFKTEFEDYNCWSGRNTLIEVFSAAILVLGVFLMEKSIITMATYMLLFSYKHCLYDFGYSAGRIWQNITDILVSSNRMADFYNEELYPTEKFGEEEIDQFKGEIEFKNVNFSYSEIEDKDEELENKKPRKKQRKEVKRIKKESVFKNLSFKIEPNTSVAFVGRSGSGKSTILSLMSKMYEADSGEILIDNINIKNLTKNSLKDNISLINQFPYIFDMTIKENLQIVKKDATDEEIWQVLEKACFAEDVRSFPKGIETKVGETGIKLSGGQRQRLAIARALLKETKMILFDESTSSLDNFAQRHIQQSIDNMSGSHTIVIVAHRLSTIKNVDTIYFLKNGEICDSGSFEHLFNTNEEFKEMFLMENILEKQETNNTTE